MIGTYILNGFPGHFVCCRRGDNSSVLQKTNTCHNGNLFQEFGRFLGLVFHLFKVICLQLAYFAYLSQNSFNRSIQSPGKLLLGF